MEVFSNPVVLVIIGWAGALAASWAKQRVEEFTTRTDRMEDRADERADKQNDLASRHAALETRVNAVEEATRTMADAVERLARLEEWRVHSMPRLDRSDATAEAVIALSEQIKTIFKRMDALPDEVATRLLRHVRARSA